MRGYQLLSRLIWWVGAAFVLTSSWGVAGDWPGWRGPTGMGHSDEKNLPLTWGGKENENVLWKAPLRAHGSNESPGYSSPIVRGDRVFITTVILPESVTEHTAKRVAPEQHVICYQAKSGKQLWDTLIPAGPCRLWKSAAGYAVPTPAADGERVYAQFGSAVVACLDFNGSVVWRKELPGPFPPTQSQSSCGSPVVHQGLVVVSYFRDFYRLAALNTKNGELAWESREPHNCSTPALISRKGKKQLLVHASRAVQGLDPADGKILWTSHGHGSWSSPVYGSGLVYADSGSGDGRPGVAIDPDKADAGKLDWKWRTSRLMDTHSSPLIVGDYLYRVQKPGIIACRKLTTGEQVYAERLPGVSLWSSPFATADGRIYFVSANKGYVIRSGAKFQILSTNDLHLGGNDFTSPAISSGRIFVKAQSVLCCIGKE